MKSVIFSGNSQLILQVMLIISILVVIQGHNYSGGGFIGGLIAASATALYLFAFLEESKSIIKKVPRVIAIGLVLMFVGVGSALLYAKPVASGTWWNFSILGESIKLGSPLLFDFGIYFVVFGSITLVMTALVRN